LPVGPFRFAPRADIPLAPAFMSTQVQLPHFEFGGWDDAETKIAADQNAIQAAVAPWRAVGEAWLRDPKRNPAVLYEAAKKGTTQ